MKYEIRLSFMGRILLSYKNKMYNLRIRSYHWLMIDKGT